jgi:transaldolase
MVMREHAFLKWMTEKTPTRWCNDSALTGDYKDAILYGAIGCTTNPPLTYQAITERPELYRDKVEEIKRRVPLPSDRAVEYIGIVVKNVSDDFKELYRNSGGKIGYVRSQVEPQLSRNAVAMFEQGKKIARINENVMVKIPGTKAGIWVLEELVALGIPTTATVCASLPQIIETAKAYDRGCERAVKAGIKPPQSTTALVMGRLQDYLNIVNEQRGCPVTASDLEIAVLAVVKRANTVFAEKGYSQTIMPAAFRSARQVFELAGGNFHMTIHPKIQDLIIEKDKMGLVNRETLIQKPMNEAVVNKVIHNFPEFRMAYEPDGMTIEDFDDFGATKLTLDGFDKTGWQKLLAL